MLETLTLEQSFFFLAMNIFFFSTLHYRWVVVKGKAIEKLWCFSILKNSKIFSNFFIQLN